MNKALSVEVLPLLSISPWGVWSGLPSNALLTVRDFYGPLCRRVQLTRVKNLSLRSKELRVDFLIDLPYSWTGSRTNIFI
jgi:hypothetical protein